MKNLMKIMMLVAVAAMSFVSCSNEFEDVNVKNETFELVISAEKPALESDSRTEFNNGSIIWSASDQIRACYYHSTGVWSKYYASTTNNISADGSTATFSGFTEFPAQSTEGTYTFYAGYPKNAIGGGNTAAPTAGELSVELPTKQNMSKLGTFDANADIMLGVAQDVVAAPVTEISVRWYRMVAHGCVTLQNLPAEEEETVYTVTFTAPESVKLSGNGTINFVDEAMSDLDNNTVAVTLPTNTAAKFTELPVWFCSAPATIAAGANLTIAVETTRGTYTRTITARDGGIKFMQNRYNTLSVDMASAEFKAAEVSTDVWAQVTSLADVTAGTYVIVGDGFYCPNDEVGIKGQPLAKTIASNNVSIADGKLVGTVADGMKWTFSGTADAMTITKFGGSDKLYITNDNNGMRLGAGDGLAWNIVDNGDGTFTLKYPLTDVRRLTLYYASGVATDWRSYKMNTADASGSRLSTLSLYQLQVPADPDAPTLSVDKSELTFAVEGGSQTVTATTTNYDGAITASSNNSHFTVSVSGNVVTVTAPANEEGTEQTATITIKAGDLSKSVAVSQEANTSALAGTGEGTQTSPYDVTRAYAVIDAANGATVEGVYVKGIVTDVVSFNSTYKSLTYHISVDGTATNKLQAYSGKNLGNTDFASTGDLHVGDEVVIYGDIKKYNTTYEFDYNNYIVSLNCPHAVGSIDQTIVFDVKPATVTIGKTVTVKATAFTTVTYSSNNTAVATVDASTGVVSGIAAGTATITATAAAEGVYKSATVSYTITVEAAQAGVVEGGRDDFNTATANASYGTRTSTAGWTGTNCAVLQGGSSDSSPTFKSLLGTDASVKAFVINGKTTAKGTITSPTLTTGCGTLELKYGYPFGESNAPKFQVDVKQNGSVVKTFTVSGGVSTKFAQQTWSADVNVAGDFQIVITNLSPSNSTSNKDRTAIWDVIWTGYEG